MGLAMNPIDFGDHTPTLAPTPRGCFKILVHTFQSNVEIPRDL